MIEMSIRRLLTMIVVATGIAWALSSAPLLAGENALSLPPAEYPEFVPANMEHMALALPDRPSIAVLPFTNMSSDPEQEYFVDGMTEDLITDLSKLSGLFVIARNSSFSYKGRQVKVNQVAEELGVRYVLEGSVRRVGDEVRINAQLIDATTGGHLWAKRYDCSLDDVFALQDEITQKIVTALAVTLTSEEEVQQAKRSTNSTGAHDAFLQGWAHYILGTRADLAKAKSFFEEAIRLDPDYARAHAGLATVFWDVYSSDWTAELGILSIEAEDGWIEHLDLAMNVPNALAHTLQSRMLVSQARYQEAVVEADKAVALEGSKATALASLANALVLVGRSDEGLKLIQDAMRLDPHYPPNYLTTLGAAQFGMEHYEAAAATFEHAVKRNVDDYFLWIYLASSYGHLGRIKDAEDAIGSANQIRAMRGESFLVLERDLEMAHNGRIDYTRVGERQVRERVNAGLTNIPALTWQNLVTHFGGDFHRFEIEGVTEIDVLTAKSLHDSGVTFVDARSERFRNEQGWIPGSVSLPEARSNTPNNRRLTEKTLASILDKTDEVVFYSAGLIDGDAQFSAFASAKAVNWGYQIVFNFWGRKDWKKGGFHGWKDAGYPVETVK